MNKEIAKKWVEALRSGKYKQAKRKLCVTQDDGTPTGFCCLGVLCDLAEQAGVVAHVTLGSRFDPSAVTNAPAPPIAVRQYYPMGGPCPPGSAGINTLIYEVMDWADIGTDTGRFRPARSQPLPDVLKNHDPDDMTELTALNDKGATFDEIADVIEQYAEDL